jgi:hypothetical protein
MSYFTNTGVTRDAIYTALGTKISTTLGLNKFIRGWVTVGNLDVANSPTGFLHQAASKPIQKRGLPPRYIDKAHLLVAFANQTTDPGFTISPATALNNLRDLLDTALVGDQGDAFVCTLGGLVEHCWVTDDTIFEAISGSPWTCFRTFIEIQYFSANNMHP